MEVDTKDILGHYARRLTQEERGRLDSDQGVLSDYRKGKLEKEAKKNWDLFYKRNSTHFFKDRHWITREFPELLEPLLECDRHDDGGSGGVGGGGGGRAQRVYLEAGCGVGNTVFPLMEENKELFVCACDFSPKAIQLLKAHPNFNEERCHAFVCDLTVHPLPALVARGVNSVTRDTDSAPTDAGLTSGTMSRDTGPASPMMYPASNTGPTSPKVDSTSNIGSMAIDSASIDTSPAFFRGVNIASLFFVLSAIAPEKMLLALGNVFNVLCEGGLLLVRDYGLYDHAQLRFGKGHKIEENFYARQDGTRAYYFSEEKLMELAEGAGFHVVVMGYVQKETVNHKEKICAPRIFIQAKLRKPFSTP